MCSAPRSACDSTLLSFDQVRFAVGEERELLHSVSLDVTASKVSVLAGPSGAGKSTLLRLGNRLGVPSAGHVRFRGVDITELDPRELRRRVGMVFQRPVPFPGTVRENLVTGSPRATERECEEVLERVGLDVSMMGRVADELSGGEAQRMCIARTLLTEPSVLLMDEPTSSLDQENRLGIERLVRELASEGLGILWVSHDLEQVRRLADSVDVLIDGRNATMEEEREFLGFGQSGEGR